MQWLADRGPVPQHVGALLLFDTSDTAGATTAEIRAEISVRLGRLPVLHRRPVRPPRGCGGWLWATVDLDPRDHVHVEPCAGATLQEAAAAAAACVIRRLPADRPPWAAYVLESPEGPLGVVVTVHHVLADGLAGMALLADLLDGGRANAHAASTEDSSLAGLAAPTAARPAPPRRVLLADAWARRWSALRGLPDRGAELRAAWAEMGRGDTPRASRSSLNRPTGSRREVVVIDLDLAAVRHAAHAYDASVNDALLVSVAAALGRLQLQRGERLARIAISVPVAARQAVAANDVGNSVGAVPFAVPTTGDLNARLREVTRSRRQRLTARHGASQPLVLAAFGVLSALHLVRLYTNHQRLVNTFVTNVRGPSTGATLLGQDVRHVVPLVVNQGNVAISFAAITYADLLTVVVMTDPDAGLPAQAVAEALQRETEALVRHT
jgi:WS/DGAT/MGAT family acyltransferase